MKPITSLTCLVLGAALLAGCTKVQVAGSGGRHSYTHPHELRFAAASDIQQLNALINESQYEEYLNSMTEAWLIKTDAHGDATVPELATEVPSLKNGGIGPDGKTITWHLRHGVKWSDGAPFDGDDVVFSTKQVLNPANNVVSRDGWDQIVKIDEPDKYTVVYHLKKPYSAFADTFFSTASANPCVLPKHLLDKLSNLNEAPYNSLPVGIGPFKYQEWNRGSSIVMVANDLYFRGRPKLDRITYYTVQDRNTVLEQLRTHDLDLWIPISPHYFPQAAAFPGMATSRIASLTFDHLDFNLRSSVLQDLKVREALRYATDRKALNDKVNNGLYLLDESSVTPASKYHVALPLVPFSISKANAELDSDGWVRGPDGIRAKDGRRLSLVFATASGSPDTDTKIELIRAAWKKLGVDFDVKHYPDSQFFAPAAEGGIIYGGKFDVVTFGWGAGPSEDQANLYACYRFTPDGQNDMHWCDPKNDAAILGAEHSYDDAVRAKDIAISQRESYAQVPTVVLDARVQLAVYNNDLKNWHPNDISPFDDMMNVDI